MLHLIRNDRREYSFVNPLAKIIKPVEFGDHRESSFVSKEDAKDAARNSGYWIDGDSAKEH